MINLLPASRRPASSLMPHPLDSGKKQVIWVMIFLLLFSMAAGGFPSAVHGSDLETLSQTEGTINEAVYGSGTQPVITSWDEFRTSFGRHNHAVALQAGSMVIDGVLDEWGGYAELQLPENSAQIVMSGWTGKDDVSASVYMAYDDQYFYWAAKVTDNVHTPVSDSTMWRGDSIQFAFSPDGTYGPEYAINYMDGQAHLWQFSEGKAVAGADQITAAATQNGHDTFYEVRMPWKTIYSGKPETGVLPFTMLFNDNDGAGRRGWMEWTPGIGKAKSPSLHARIHLVPQTDDWSFWVEGPQEVTIGSTVSYSVYAVNWRSEPRSLHLSSDSPGAQQDITIPGRSTAQVDLPFITGLAGSHELDFTLSEPASGRSEHQTVGITAVMTASEVGAMLNAIAVKLPALEQLLLQCEAQGLSTDYERINYTVIKDFVNYGKDDIAQGRLSRAYYVAVELGKLYDEGQAQLQGYLAGSRTPQSVPRYVSGPTTISGYSFIGNTEVRSSGVTEERPIFFTGYGAFTKVREDVPKFQDLGANIIQIELGPRDVILDKKDFINQYTLTRSGNVNATAAPVAGISHTGDYSLKIANASPTQANVFAQVGQTITVEPNTTYDFKVWVKGENAKNVWFPGGSGLKQRKSFPSGTYDWREVTYQYTTGASEVSYKLVVVSENVGTIYVDDLSVTKAGSTVNLLKNPGFEDLGGYSEDKEYVVSTNKIESDIEQVLARGEENHVAVNLLISPHYFPAWALTKWPELNVANNGFIKFSLFQPMAKAIIEDYLRALIPMVNKYDSLHSITLSNESVYQANKDAYALPAWHDYLGQIYNGDINQLNSVYKTSYSSFTEVPMPANVSATADSYDYVMFNQDYFARWHEWMAGIIHELAPNLPVHAKIMGDPRGSLSWGVDIERFSELSQINGNDNWNYINEGPKGFMEELSFYDLQASFKQAPVFNSEQHLIADGDKMYTPEQAKHVRSALWQSAIHGRSGSTMWIWERTYDESSSREGSILHRPDAVAAAGRTGLDLNRLAKEVTAFQNEHPQAAILYSVAAGVFSGDYSNMMLRSYEALSYSGHKAGFISEKQVKNGGLGAYKLLIVPYATRVDPATLTGIKQFIESGGRVLLIGSHALELEPHGAEQSASDRDYIFAHADKISAADWTAAQLRTFLLPILQSIDPMHMLLVEPASGELPYNVEWRSVNYGGRKLLNAVNYGPSPVTAAIRSGDKQATGLTNLITGETEQLKTVELQPLTPYLFTVDSMESIPGGSTEEPQPEPILVQSITITGASSIVEGGQLQLTASVSPDNADNKAIHWNVTSVDGSATSLASVSQLGLLTAAAPGVVEVTASAQDGSGVITAYRVTITAKATEPTDPGDGNSTSGPDPDHSSTTKPDPDSVPKPGPVQESMTVKDEASGIMLNGDKEYKYISGYEDGTFRPDNAINRAEFAQLLYRLTVNANKEKAAGKSVFGDVEQNAWYTAPVQYLGEMGLFGGYEDGTFRPNQILTRAEIAVILSRFVDAGKGAKPKDFPDAKGHWAEASIRILASNGYILGYEDGTFRPDSQVTRAECIAMLNRVLNRMPTGQATESGEVAQTSLFTDLPPSHWAYRDITGAASSGLKLL
jgi:uncharacterized protein YjdB